MIGLERPMGHANRRFATIVTSVLLIPLSVLANWLTSGFWQAMALMLASTVLAVVNLSIGYDMGYRDGGPG